MTTISKKAAKKQLILSIAQTIKEVNVQEKDTKLKLKGEGAKLVGNPDELINLMFSAASNRKQVLNQVVNEGAADKQVLSALLLKQLFKFVQAFELKQNTKFELQQGLDILMKEGNHALPISFPINLDSTKNQKKIIEAISHAPEHEALVFAMCMQVIEWSLSVMAKK